MRAALQALPGEPSLKVGEAKREEVDFLIKRAQSDGAIFTGLSLFVALAGSALVVNLGLALAEERRPRHAVLRALGLSRTGMITLSVLEGALYSLAAAVAALVPGAVVGLALAQRFQGGTVLYSYALENRVGPLLYSITAGSVALSIAIGALIVLATLFATSVRSSRMQISSAIKNLPEPVRRKRSLWRTALLAGLGLGSLAAVVVGSLPVRLAGGVGLVIMAAALVSGRVSDRLRATITGAALTAWAAIEVGGGTNLSGEFQMLGLGALVAVFGLSLVVASNLRVLEIPAGWLQGGARATLRPSLAYLTRRPLRAGLGTGAFAVVLALMTITAVLLPTFVGAVSSGLDEFDIRVDAPTTPGLSLPDSVRPQIVREIAMPTRPFRGDVSLSTGAVQKDQYVPLYALSSTQLAAAPFQLASRDSRFKSDAEVWQALGEDPHLVITPSYQTPGVTITLAGPDGPVQFHVVGVPKTLGLEGLVGSEAAMATFATLPVGTTILAKTAPGADATAVARQIEREVFSQGADTTTVKEMMDTAATGTRALTDFIRLVMGLGLLVGVVSLGILALRAVIERRRSIGVLRALGYRPGQVLAGIVSEGLITATCGALVGIGIGVLMAALFIPLALPGAPIEIDASTLAVIVGLIYISVLAVTIPPALRAARLPAVEALRLED